MTKTIDALVEALEESARLLGGTQSKKMLGIYTPDDARFEVAMHQSIAKHKTEIRAALAQARAEQAEPFAWLVCSVNADGSLSLEHAAAWQEAAHQHVNEAISEHDIEEAAAWVVRPAYLAAPVAKTCDMGQMCLGCEPKRPDGGCPDAAPVAKLEPWQPIETAPKDGRHVLIANDTPGSIHPCEGYYVTPEHRYGKEPKHAGWWRLAGSSEASVHGRTPTHWMPLPPPPVAAHNAKLGGAG